MAETAAQIPDTSLATSPWSRPSLRIGALVGGMLCFGLVMVVSAESNGAGLEGLRNVLLRRLSWVAMGGLAFAIGAVIDYQAWRRHNLPLLALAVGVLVAVLVPGIGSAVNGARRWIRFGVFGFQPSEFAKVALLIWLAAYCERHMEGSDAEGRSMRRVTTGFLVPLAVIGTMAALVLVEPDFGTSVLISSIGVAVLLLSGTRLLYVLLVTVAALPLAQALVFNVPYRLRRVTAFLDPWAHPRGSGYQLVQSLIALGSGGIAGKGLGGGSMGFLPAARNDFIFSAVGEQLGFLGSAVLILAFLWLLWEGIGVALRARDRFAFVLAFGISLLIALQAAVHLAVVTGSVPTKGLSLPFISAGGSSLFFSLWAAGILVNIACSEERPEQVEITPWQWDMPGYERSFYAAARRTGTALWHTITRKGG